MFFCDFLSYAPSKTAIDIASKVEKVVNVVNITLYSAYSSV